MRFEWSQAEKKVARRAFDHAYEREVQEMMDRLRSQVAHMKEARDLWKIEEILRKKRKEIDRKYDYRYSQLIMVFARLMSEGHLEVEDLEGLDQEKINAIVFISQGSL